MLSADTTHTGGKARGCGSFRRRLQLAVLVLQFVQSLGSPLPHGSLPLRHLRGGSADADATPALTREEVSEKLNNIPTFAILNAEDQMISLGAAGAEPCFTFYTDAVEVQAVLQQAAAANSALDLHLGVTPLGIAFEMCGGWAQVGGEARSSSSQRFKLQGPSESLDDPSKLVEQLEMRGINGARWLLPVFAAEAFHDLEMIPWFLSKADLAAGWVRTGRPELNVPEKLISMDIRDLVLRMQTAGSTIPWRKVQLISSMQAIELAQATATEED